MLPTIARYGRLVLLHYLAKGGDIFQDIVDATTILGNSTLRQQDNQQQDASWTWHFWAPAAMLLLLAGLYFLGSRKLMCRLLQGTLQLVNFTCYLIECCGETWSDPLEYLDQQKYYGTWQS
jgi:hypothetical protein